jgi:hypothetical protein
MTGDILRKLNDMLAYLQSLPDLGPPANESNLEAMTALKALITHLGG